MPWKSGFYYQNKRVGTRVKTSYVGTGDFAKLIAKLDEYRRLEREIAAEKERAELAELAAGDAEFDELDQAVQAVVVGVLIATGHHSHKRTWRKKRT